MHRVYVRRAHGRGLHGAPHHLLGRVDHVRRGNGTDITSQVEDGNCDKPTLGSVVTQASCKLTGTPTLVNAGTCTPSTSTFPNKGPWQQRLDACGVTASAGSCGAGKVCVPTGSGAAGESLCVRQDGTAPACPAGWTTFIQGYTGGTDDRACGACVCGDGDSACSDGHYTFYAQPNCTTNTTMGSTDVSSNACTGISADLGSAKATLPTASGKCPASGGMPTGAVSPSGPFTYCCQ